MDVDTERRMRFVDIIIVLAFKQTRSTCKCNAFFAYECTCGGARATVSPLRDLTDLDIGAVASKVRPVRSDDEGDVGYWADRVALPDELGSDADDGKREAAEAKYDSKYDA